MEITRGKCSTSRKSISSMWLVLANKRLGVHASGVGSHSPVNHVQSGKERKRGSIVGVWGYRQTEKECQVESLSPPVFCPAEVLCPRESAQGTQRAAGRLKLWIKGCGFLYFRFLSVISRFLQHRRKTIWSCIQRPHVHHYRRKKKRKRKKTKKTEKDQDPLHCRYLDSKPLEFHKMSAMEELSGK